MGRLLQVECIRDASARKDDCAKNFSLAGNPTRANNVPLNFSKIWRIPYKNRTSLREALRILDCYSNV